MLGFIKELCQKFTGSNLSMPRWSEWSLVDPGQASIGVDVADVATAGAGAVAPVNIKVYGSHFSTKLKKDNGTEIKLGGYGGGGGIGAGWGIPFVGGKATGKISSEVAREIAEKAGGAAQGKVIDMLKDATGLGISGGTRLLYGPDAPAQGMNPFEFRGYVTVVSLGANFIVNGVSASMALFSNNRPIDSWNDFLHVTAVGLIGSMGLGLALDVEVNAMLYVVRPE